jgi:preprotein translocase subunit SecF
MTNASTLSNQPAGTPSGSAATADESLSHIKLDLYKYRWLFIAISLIFLLPGLYFIGTNMANPEIGAPLRLGIDFKGGTLLEYGFSKPVNQNDLPSIQAVFDKAGYTGSIIQIQNDRPELNKTHAEAATSAVGLTPGSTTPVVTTTPATEAPTTKVASPTPADNPIAGIVSVRSKQIHGQDDVAIRQALEARYGDVTVLQKNSMGPALAQELFTNGLLALGLAYLLIVGYLTVRFQFDFAVCAMVALIHDTIFLIGTFAMFGALFHTEVDSLFITAILTVVGFSVHDTIVVFDRIRENLRVYYTKKIPFVQVMNISVNQTLTRSINTSLTALLTMLALYFFGGETTCDFVLAIILGIAAGTYSSIFNASVLLAMWRNRGASATTKAVAA